MASYWNSRVSIILLFCFPELLLSAVVTLHSLEIYTTHEILASTPAVYFRCSGENKTFLQDVKKKNTLYTFRGEESFQPLTNFESTKCKRCGLYEEDRFTSDDVFDEWEFCPSDFKSDDGRYVRTKGKEFNATFLCPECVKKAKKFEDLVDPSPDTDRKLELLYQIPHRERACFSEVATSEASFSSEHTPSMSSAVPKSGAKFSLADIKAKMVKKEKSEETPAPKPVHVPATRSKISARKRKVVDPITQLESFEGLTAMEVKDKMHSLYSMMHLGFEQMHELLKEYEEELLRSKEAYNDLKKLAEKKDGYYKQKEEAYANVSREFEEFKVKAEEKEKLIVEEAKNSATTTIFESMYEMAKEAKATGFSLPHWDLQGWATILGKEDDLGQADSKAPEAATRMEGAGDGVATGDDSKDAQA